MPRQSLSSVRPQRLVLSGEERVQNELIKKLGPYFARAKMEDRGPEFLTRVFNVWFTRWPLKPSDFEDADFMKLRRQSIEKNIGSRLWWACFTGQEPQYTWERYLDICEARYGVTTHTPSDSADNLKQDGSQVRTKPRPRPVLKKMIKREESPSLDLKLLPSESPKL